MTDTGPQPAANQTIPPASALVDRFGRVHTDLRLSVTDRCTLRCTYCMPLDAAFRPREELLTDDECVRVATVAARLGIRSIRVTGGEPLLRSGLAGLVARLVAIPGMEEVALTTNGLLLAQQAEGLFAAGLSRLNVSLDALSEEVFERVARAGGLERVLAGLTAAKRVGFRGIRINAVSIRDLTESEIVPLASFCRREGFHLRFIEFMPLDADSTWSNEKVLSGTEVRQILEREVGALLPRPRTDPSQPAVDFDWGDRAGSVGFIDPVSAPFCGQCDRLRLTADGQLRNCLFSTVEWDARGLLRSGDAPLAVEGALETMLRDCVQAKHAAHGIGAADFHKPQRAMYQIGG